MEKDMDTAAKPHKTTPQKTTTPKKPRASRQKLSLHGVTLAEAQAGLLAAGLTPDKVAQKAQHAQRAKERAWQTHKQGEQHTSDKKKQSGC